MKYLYINSYKSNNMKKHITISFAMILLGCSSLLIAQTTLKVRV